MKRFIEGDPRLQSVLFPEQLDDWIAEDNPVRVVDAFVDELDLKALGFESAAPAATGRPAYHPGTLLKIYLYGYLNRVQSTRRLERESQRNVELIWLTGRLSPDFKTLADFRRDNGPGIRKACAQFVRLCREMALFSQALIAIDGSKFKAVNNRDRNFTPHKLEAQRKQLESSAARYLEEVSDPKRVHAVGLPTDQPLGARGCDRGCAGSLGANAAREPVATADRRARVRHAEIVDGVEPLPDAATTRLANGDEPARSGLQPEACDADPGREAVDRGDPGLRPLDQPSVARSCEPSGGALSHSLGQTAPPK